MSRAQTEEYAGKLKVFQAGTVNMCDLCPGTVTKVEVYDTL